MEHEHTRANLCTHMYTHSYTHFGRGGGATVGGGSSAEEAGVGDRGIGEHWVEVIELNVVMESLTVVIVVVVVAVLLSEV